jgi:Na+/H+ antiporter NhaD/arsenite permease-like protein
MAFSVWVLLVVFACIAIRQVGRVRLQIWQVMLAGAATVLATGQISPLEALRSIDPDIMIFLAGMFVLGRALEESGWLAHSAYNLFSRAKSTGTLLFFIVATSGVLSALLMNNTIAIIGTPLVVMLTRRHSIYPVPLLLALAFSVTIGSAMSPVGNPQNLLIAMKSGMANPFESFAVYLLPPTMLNMFFITFWLKLRYRKHFSLAGLEHKQEPLSDSDLAILSRNGLILASVLVILKLCASCTGNRVDFPFTWIALGAMLPVVAFSRRRWEIVRGIDWPTLAFMAAMFVLMQSVWKSGFFQGLLLKSGVNITTLPAIMSLGILVSQLVTNVPLVALYLSFLTGEGAKSFAALAAASTIAGNVLITGAASNVIIIQQAEDRGVESFTFLEFALAGIPLTIVNALIYWAWFSIMQ